MSFTMVTVTGQAILPGGSGTARFVLSGPMSDGVSTVYRPNGWTTTVTDGVMAPVVMPSTEDPTTVGGATYTAWFTVAGQTWKIPPFALPAVATIDVAALEPVTPGPPVYPAPTVTVGTVSTGAPGSEATVENAGTPYAAVLDFGIPQGTTGAPGVVQSVVAADSSIVVSGTTAAPKLSAVVAIAAETTRAETAEQANATAIANETTRAEAAEAAAENAAIAQAEAYVQSRAQNLFTNGLGGLGSNYNMSATTFDTVDAPFGRGSFKFTAPTSGSQLFTNDELIAVDSSRLYRMGMYAKAGNLDGSGIAPGGASSGYIGLYSYDIDGNLIQPYSVIIGAGTMTTLAAPLNPGDTTIALTSAANWFAGSTTSSALNGISWYPYVNNEGYSYPYDPAGVIPGYAGKNTSWQYGAANLLYSSIVGNVLQLNKAWTGPALAAGTPVANAHSGGYTYIAMTGQQFSTSWTWYEGNIDGQQTVVSQANHFVPGTSYVRFIFLNNYTQNQAAGNTFRYSDIQFSLVDNGLWLPAPAGQNGWVTTNLQYRRTADSHVEFDGYVTSTPGTTPNGTQAAALTLPSVPNFTARTQFDRPVWASPNGTPVLLTVSSSTLSLSVPAAGTTAQTVYLTGVSYPITNS